MSLSNGTRRLSLFGEPSFGGGNGLFFPIKGYVLITAILLAPTRAVSREEAASLLWETVPQHKALASLRQLLLRMGQFDSASLPLLVLKGDRIEAGPLALKSDLAEFLTSLRSNILAEQIAGLTHVQGDLLRNVALDGVDGEVWINKQRVLTSDKYFSSFDRILEDLTRFGVGEADLIEEMYQNAVKIDPDREETYRSVISAFARLGKVKEAERVYAALQRILELDGRGAESATLNLMRRIRSNTQSLESETVETSARTSLPRVAFECPRRIDGKPARPIILAFVDDVANGLARYRTFAVIAPYSSFKATATKAIDEIHVLRADYIVKAAVFDDGIVTFSLISQQNNEIVWSMEVSSNHFHIHDSFRILAKNVAMSLADKIERLNVALEPQHEPTAYRHLLNGQQLLRGKCDLPTLRRARAEFRKSVGLDRTFAVSRARIAQTLQLEWLMLGGNDPHLLHRAKAEANASVEIDPALGIGQWMSAVVALYQRDFDLSAQMFLEAEALAPNSADFLIQHADALGHFGQVDLAWERFNRAIDLNPLAPDIYWWAGATIALKRAEYSTAVQLCQRMDDEEPALRVLAASHALNGDLSKARAYGARLSFIYPNVTAREMVGMHPDRDPEANERFYEGLRLAGLS